MSFELLGGPADGQVVNHDPEDYWEWRVAIPSEVLVAEPSDGYGLFKLMSIPVYRYRKIRLYSETGEEDHFIYDGLA